MPGQISVPNKTAIIICINDSLASPGDYDSCSLYISLLVHLALKIEEGQRNVWCLFYFFFFHECFQYRRKPVPKSLSFKLLLALGEKGLHPSSRIFMQPTTLNGTVSLPLSRAEREHRHRRVEWLGRAIRKKSVAENTEQNTDSVAQ